jgi:predicted phosphatase
MNNIPAIPAIAIFDLDETLWDHHALYPATQTMLDLYKDKGVIMYVVSFNISAKQICSILDIAKYFKSIYGDPRARKSTIINNILEDHLDVDKSRVLFYDDDPDNILDVSTNCGIPTALVTNQNRLM